MRFRRRRSQVRENPFDRAARLIEDGHPDAWLARKFLLMTERLAEVESVLVQAFEAGDRMAFVDLDYRIEDAYNHLPKVKKTDAPDAVCRCGHTAWHHVFGACDVTRGGVRVDNCVGFAAGDNESRLTE